MTDREILQAFTDFLSRSRSFKVWFEEHADDKVAYTQSPGSFIYLADNYSCYRFEIRDATIKILDTQNCTYESYELSDPDGMRRIAIKFDIDEDAEPKKSDPIDAIVNMMGHI